MSEQPGRYPSLESIIKHHEGVVGAIRDYFSMLKENFSILKIDSGFQWPEWLDVGDTSIELDNIRDNLLVEEGVRTCFALVAYIEDTFKAHFLYVINIDNQNALFGPFQKIYAKRKSIKRVSFKKDILKTWQANVQAKQDFYDDLNKAFDFRNWFAHGRFFALSSASTGNASYNYSDLLLLAKDAKNLCQSANAYLS